MIIVCRSRAPLAATVRAVRRACPGEDVVGLAVSETVPVLGLRIPAGATGLILTSAAAVPAVPQTTLPVWCVGKVTARAARRAGLHVAGVGTADGVALAERMAKEAPGVWVHFCASNAGLDWHGLLEKAGHRVMPVVAYRTVMADGIIARVRQKLAENDWTHTLVCSPAGARHLLELLEKARIKPRGTLLALSPAVAQAAKGAFKTTRAADRPELNALLALLKEDA